MFVGTTFLGRGHDYTIFKTEFSPDEPWFDEMTVYVDLGYQGIQTDYPSASVEIPHKKPRKSKANPEPQLTQEQKAYNRTVSKIRIFVENAICGLKRFNILVHRFRNQAKNFDDEVIGICAGLWNFLLTATV